jgi:LysR family transcriptional regulator for metE and metH
VSELERRHYQLLVAIDRHGTISAAARSLFITQSAASQQLRQADQRLGFALTTRSGRSVALTPAARRLVEAATISENALSAGEADARWLASTGQPSLRVALGLYDNTAWLGRVQADLDRRAETAPIELVRTCDGHGLKSVLEGRVHAAIVPSGQQAGTHESRHLFDDELVAVVSTQSDLANRTAVTPDDLRGTRYVTFGTTPEEGFEYRNFLAPHNVTVDNILRVESTQAIINIVAATKRVSILSRWAVPANPGVAAIPLEPPPPAISWSLATGDLDGDPPIAATADHLVDHMNRNGPIA